MSLTSRSGSEPDVRAIGGTVSPKRPYAARIAIDAPRCAFADTMEGGIKEQKVPLHFLNHSSYSDCGCTMTLLRADQARVEWNADKKQWHVEISVGAEVVKRWLKQPHETADATLQSMAIATAK